MRDITHYIKEELEISESSKELSFKDAKEVLKGLGFKKGEDFKKGKDGGMYATSEEVAMSIADEITDSDYELTYDDKTLKLTIHK
ncbi:hypothetical protein BPT24_130 [Tenacibaculum phage pT24]|uniref:Uncharacterized protein n=1 Tax=Tenacibaculum phage pT24 TaxID=1880590 RepID=A0A1B4XWT2_9CAUD|nr:hypothetical protein HYP10_gp130 [Tenacibaculum phage pT24]BAV39255.1 hypothetical protein BPT24_130 [Tenacibaculum phage pT24]